MAIKLLLNILVLIGLYSVTEAKTKSFMVRTLDSSAKDYLTNINRENKLSYIEWILHAKKTTSPFAPSLDQALELSQKAPLEAVPLYDKALQEINSSILNETGQQLIISIFGKIDSLGLPERMRNNYRKRRAEFLAIQRKEAAESFRDPVFEKEMHSFQNELLRRSEFEEAQLIVNGEGPEHLNLSARPQTPQQWAVLSNTHVPFIVYGTWEEFRQRWNETNFANQPLAEGTCEHSQILAENYELRTQAQIFVSKLCSPSQDLNESSPTPRLEPDRKWSWIIPAIAIVGASTAYYLKDKHVTVQWPSFR